jgi:hypothetical protein
MAGYGFASNPPYELASKTNIIASFFNAAAMRFVG